MWTIHEADVLQNVLFTLYTRSARVPYVCVKPRQNKTMTKTKILFWDWVFSFWTLHSTVGVSV